MPQDDPDYSDAECARLGREQKAAEARGRSSWPIAEQYFHYGDMEVTTLAHNDGFALTVRIRENTRRVFFDPAGRVTHVSNPRDPAADGLAT